jgi:ech hydrogenase subunit A
MKKPDSSRSRACHPLSRLIPLIPTGKVGRHERDRKRPLRGRRGRREQDIRVWGFDVTVILLLIGFPLLVAFILLSVRGARARSVIVIAASLVISAGALSLIFTHFSLPSVPIGLPVEYINIGMLVLESALALFIIVVSLRNGRFLPALLALLQTGVMICTEAMYGGSVTAEHLLMADKFAVIMALIVGVVGSLISVYALGYMKAYHERRSEVPDRRRLFFFLQFIFLSAMFGLLFSNNLLLLHFFWEVTTLCSFLLIGYNRDGRARSKAFLALTMNLLGGLAFSAAILYANAALGIVELDKLLGAGKAASLIPAVLLAFAGMTKSAQLPFSSWLLGAMVGPTPVSALLHSSTMVKAGVYLVIRLSPMLQGTLPGVMIALIGGMTFLLASLIAISQSDAKRILAYSTIANLGLIVLCGGVGTYESVWAGILLLIFHAVTKCLLFLCVGSYEQKTGARDVESMTGLIVKMPRLSIMVQIGIAGMFLAPFGMLVSKWAVLKALLDFNPLLAVFIVFGSSATLVFWVKWMGKIIEVSAQHENIEAGLGAREWVSLTVLSVLTVALVGFYPVISQFLIEPYVIDIYGRVMTLNQGNVVIMFIMLGMVALFPTTFFIYGRRVKVVDAYLAGANVDPGTRFQGAAGQVKSMAMGSYYFTKIFGESRLLVTGIIACTALVLVMFGVASIPL